MRNEDLISGITKRLDDFHSNKVITHEDFKKLIKECLSANCNLFLQGIQITIINNSEKGLCNLTFEELVEKNIVDMYFNNHFNELMLYSNKDLSNIFSKR
ncbi:hypothetical protein ACFSYG_11845 [Leeuwenhoekiella polynyae]|uniref:Uncharacterized protein n=1 Tax=Leeuwenhoekiella polynyae TaxID=1550906 RepID=A0A4V1KRQ3_9FLAO|nr:hypothetical protein [Leeuwenhoekiella polynyae]RXG25712.1 hypothetical protein DSM02_879 [Leeuwenhoekiella polynyae]